MAAESKLRCVLCGEEYDSAEKINLCRRCGGLLDVIIDLDRASEEASWEKFRRRPIGVWRYRELLPADYERAVSMGEGGTPLIRCDRLAEWIGVRRFFVKYEGANPTGSFKDRGMTLGITKAIEFKASSTICASTGNTAASLAAYSARAGLRCFVLVPKGAVAAGKLFQALMYGAEMLMVRGNFDDALKIVLKIAEEGGVYLLNSVNPWRLEGQKTAGYEVADQLGLKKLDNIHISVPVGNCGNISAIWKGLDELYRIGLIDRRPAMIAVQSEGASPFVDMIRRNSEELRPVDKPETIATAIRIGRPINWRKALRAVKQSKGMAIKVSDKEIIEAQRKLASLEGIGVEPASAASIAGVKRLVEAGELDKDVTIVAICTGTLLKDPNPALLPKTEVNEVEPDLEKIKQIILPIIRR